jgi:Icc-related predicted phosphoesterase
MAGKHLTRVLCAADPRGSSEAIQRLLEAADGMDVQAVAVVGDLGAGDGDRTASYRAVFRALHQGSRPTYWVPGPGDAPVADYLREAHNMEVVFPELHGVHGTVAFWQDTFLFSGLGGRVSDDPAGPRDEDRELSYPRWEAEYRLKLLRDLGEHDSALLFATPPAHKGQGIEGSEVLAELVNTHRPRLVVTSGERGTRMLGNSLVVAPGRLADGEYAIADLHARTAELEALGAHA